MEFYKEKDFKDTKIGEVPKDWSVDILDKYAIIKGRIGWRGLKSSEYTKEGPYLIANTHIPKNIVEWEKCDHLSRCRYEESPEIQLKVRDVIMSKDGTIGQVAYIDHLPGEATLNSTMLLLRPKYKDLCSHYLYYFLQGFQFRKFLNQKTAGGQIPHIFQRDIKKLLLTLPERKEQEQIATILSRVDDAIQKTDEIIQKTELLKKGLMQELLTKGIGHKEFKYSEELGCEIPKEWEVVNLHNVVDSENDIVAGPFGSNLKVADYRQEGVPIIRLQNIERNEFINKYIKYTSPKKAKELNYHSYKPGDIVLAKLGAPLGKTCIVPDFIDKGIIVADVVRIRISPKKAVNKYIEYILNSSICSNQLYKETIGSTRPRVNISQVRNLKIPLPTLPEQRKIASILSHVDDQIEKEQQAKEKLKKLKKGLMQILLTGKVRVKVN